MGVEHNRNSVVKKGRQTGYNAVSRPDQAERRSGSLLRCPLAGASSLRSSIRPTFVFVLLALGVFIQPASADEPPNVLFIAVDDLRDWVGHLGGHPQAKTPNIDRLALRGVSFTRAYCSAPLCNPSRISLLTGIAPARSGVYGNGEKLRDRLPNAVTLMQHFRASGYSARGAGKIFHGSRAYDEDSWDGYFRPANSQEPRRIKRDSSLPKSAWVPWGPLACSDDEMFDGKNANWIIAELEKPQKNPFFLAYGLTKPHLTWEVPQKYFDLHRVVGAFPDGNSALMLVAARLRHIAGTKWGTRRYLDMDRLREQDLEQLSADRKHEEVAI